MTDVDANFWIREPYPNPSTDVVNLDYSLARNGRTTLTVFDALGHEVYSTIHSFETEGVSHTQIPCSGLAAGTYYVRLEQGGQVRTKKFVVN
jgi:hypothetical protein